MAYPKSLPWVGRAIPMPPDAFQRAATQIGCKASAIQALWEVESAGKAFQADGTLTRRFEPHKMPGATTTWRDSLAIPFRKREEMFRAAYAANPSDALRATSWGGPQIMGFNANECGYDNAEHMVRDMADREIVHLGAFVTLIKAWGLDSAIRAHDWFKFAAKYNGDGQAAEYARRIEAAYRKASGGQRSPVVLRMNDTGEAVRRLQVALGMVGADGKFGPDTLAAVLAFQRKQGLPEDGVVGARTWRALERFQEIVSPSGQAFISPVPQETTLDGVADAVGKVAGIITAAGGAAAALNQVVPADAQVAVWYMLGGCGVMMVAAMAFRWARSL